MTSDLQKRAWLPIFAVAAPRDGQRQSDVVGNTRLHADRGHRLCPRDRRLPLSRLISLANWPIARRRRICFRARWSPCCCS